MRVGGRERERLGAKIETGLVGINESEDGSECEGEGEGDREGEDEMRANQENKGIVVGQE